MKHLLATAAVALAVGLSPPPALADLLFSADLNGTPAVRCKDQQASSVLCPGGDQNPLLGILALADNTFLGLVDLKGSVQVATIGNVNVLNSSSLQLTALDNVHIDAAVGATGFAGPVSEASTSASGTVQTGTGSTFAYAFYDDPTNTQGATNPFDVPGNQIDTFGFTSTKIADAYAHSAGPLAVQDPGLFSMTQTFDADMLAGTVLVGNSETEIKPQSVSEPGTLALLGTMLLGLGIGRRYMQGR